jgi:hypothetical protein
MKNDKYMTQERLKEILTYNPETGDFYWKKFGGRRKRGKPAGSPRKLNRVVGVSGIKYCCHRLAWLYMTGKFPENTIDHIDRNCLNNKFSNLREATVSQNLANKSRYKKKKIGPKGVYPQANKWRARITFNNKYMHLGYYKTQEAAKAAYDEAARKFYGEFACYG